MRLRTHYLLMLGLQTWLHSLEWKRCLLDGCNKREALVLISSWYRRWLVYCLVRACHYRSVLHICGGVGRTLEDFCISSWYTKPVCVGAISWLVLSWAGREFLVQAHVSFSCQLFTKVLLILANNFLFFACDIFLRRDLANFSLVMLVLISVKNSWLGSCLDVEWVETL